MKDRISDFIRNQELTPSRLADILGVQPSSISHLMSGRNKPGFDFIAKFLERFPSVNPDWLILGTGNMYRTESTGSTSAAAGELRGLFSSHTTDISEMPEPVSNPIQVNQKPEGIKPVTQQPAPAPDRVPQSSSAPAENKSNKKIERIILCFSDDTFSSYSPSEFFAR